VDPTSQGSGFSSGIKKIVSNIYVYMGILVTLCITFVLYFFFSRKKKVQKKYQVLFVSAMFVLTMILLLVIYLANKN
jgi:predicted Na+-dependent transporter